MFFCPCEDPDAIGTHYSWNSSAVQVDEAFQLIDEYGVYCEPIKVAVLDTGVYAAHNEFSKNGENRIKTDSDYVYVKKSVPYPSDEDDYFHGTHVAGIVHNNTMDNVEIYSYRMSGKTLSALSCSELTGAIDAAVTEGVDVINMSLRRGEFFKPQENETLENSLKKAIAKNIVVVAGAGNDADDANNYIPARFDEVITVSATTRENKTDTNYSNYGSCVDIGAPGTDIRSTSPRNDKNEEPESWMIRASGTSMATPLVSAAAATLKSIDPDITPAEVKRIIKETAYVPDGWDTNYGTGIVNFYNMVKAVLEPETSCQPLKIKAKNGKIEIVAPEGSDARIYYTIDGSVPTVENHIKYTEPVSFRNNYVEKIIAVCHENGKLISEPITYNMIAHRDKTVFCKWSKVLPSDEESGKATWYSRNPEIASVDENGKITGVSPGNTDIVCRYPTGERVTWNVKVQYSPVQLFFIICFFGFLWI